MSTMYQEYRNRVKFKGASKRNYVNTKVAESIDSLINDSQYGFTITKDGQQYDVAILSTKSTQDYERANIIAHNEVGLDRGSLFNWDNANWIVLQKMFRPEQPGFNGYAYRCTGELKWIDENGKLQIRPAYISSGRTTNSLTYTPDVNYKFDNIFLHDTDWSMIAAVQQDLTLHNEMRFLVKGKAYRVTNIDNVSIDNVSILSMVDDKLRDSDDTENNIADLKAAKAEYIIQPSVVFPIQLYAGDIKDIPVKVLRNGIETEEEIVYTSLTEDIVSIDNNNMIGRGIGVGQIKCMLAKNNMISTIIDINVSEVHEPDTEEKYIEGSDYILWNTSETYIVKGATGVFMEPEFLSGVKHSHTIENDKVTINIKDKYAGTIIIKFICDDGTPLTKEVFIKTA